MGAEEITEFLTHLAVNEKVSASTQNQAFFEVVSSRKTQKRQNYTDLHARSEKQKFCQKPA